MATKVGINSNNGIQGTLLWRPGLVIECDGTHAGAPPDPAALYGFFRAPHFRVDAYLPH